jgi:hypothetical protein
MKICITNSLHQSSERPDFGRISEKHYSAKDLYRQAKILENSLIR